MHMDEQSTHAPATVPISTPQISDGAAASEAPVPPRASPSLLQPSAHAAAAAPRAAVHELVDLVTRALQTQHELLLRYLSHVLQVDGEALSVPSANSPMDEAEVKGPAELLNIEGVASAQVDHEHEGALETAVSSVSAEPTSTLIADTAPSSFPAHSPLPPLAVVETAAVSPKGPKRGRAPLNKCEKHRRWKKRCPNRCFDHGKTVNSAGKVHAQGSARGGGGEDNRVRAVSPTTLVPAAASGDEGVTTVADRGVPSSTSPAQSVVESRALSFVFSRAPDAHATSRESPTDDALEEASPPPSAAFLRSETLSDGVSVQRSPQRAEVLSTPLSIRTRRPPCHSRPPSTR